MIIAFHSIFGMYGFWLPNDPRGSGSDYVASWELFRYGAGTKVESRRSVAAQPHDVSLRFAAKQSLQFAPVTLDERQAAATVDGFARACDQSGYHIHACAVLPDHVHLVIGRHVRDVRQIVGHCKGNATLELKRSGLWTKPDQPVWGEHGWNVFLDDLKSVERAIRYVEDNPIKEKRPRQHWPFVTPFEA